MKEVGEFGLRFLFLNSVFRIEVGSKNYLNMRGKKQTAWEMPRPLPSLGSLFYFAAPLFSLVIVCLELVTISDA